jgi:glycosyltransferase involved in cell wall biosynthesis
VCSDTSSLPEIAGEAALLIDPCVPEELADGMSRILTDQALQRQLIERGRRRAKQFSWWRFTTDIARILHRVRDMRKRV